MMKKPQHATNVGAGEWRRVAVFGLAMLMLPGVGSAAGADRVRAARLHHAAVQQEIVPSESHAKAEAAKSKEKTTTKHRTTARNSRNSKPAPKASAAVTKKRHKRPEPELVDDPIPLHRASARKREPQVVHETAVMTSHAKKEVVASKAVAPASKPDVDAPVVAAANKKLTVDDFVRAANGGVAPGDAAEVADRGVSHPDDAAIETSDAEAPKVKAVAAVKAAPIVRAAPVAKSSVSDAGVRYEDAPHPDDVPVVKAAAKRQAVVDDRAEQEQAEITDDAVKPLVVPIYSRSGKLIMPPPLKGTHEILVHQNAMADNAGLTRIQDDQDLNRMRAQKLLVPFPDIASLEVNEELPLNRRYARPWTVKFASDTARAFYARFHEPLRLNSAVRTVDYQLRLQRVNGNAAAVDGDGASPHLTGQAIDFGKRGMSAAEIAWMRTYLLPLMQSGKLDVEEEFQQACFHISVYGSYMPKRAAPKTELAQLHGQ